MSRFNRLILARWPHIRPDRVLTEAVYNATKQEKSITPQNLSKNLTERELWDRDVNIATDKDGKDILIEVQLCPTG